MRSYTLAETVCNCSRKTDMASFPSAFRHVVKFAPYEAAAIKFYDGFRRFYCRREDDQDAYLAKPHDALCNKFIYVPLSGTYVCRLLSGEKEIEARVHNQEKQNVVYVAFRSRAEFEELMADMRERSRRERHAERKLFEPSDGCAYSSYSYARGLEHWTDVGTYAPRLPSELIGFGHPLDRISRDVDTRLRNAALLAEMGEGNKSLNYLLYGPPGSGKTTLILTYASMHGLPVYVMNSATKVHSGQLRRMMSPRSDVSPVTVLMYEDFDTYLAANVSREGSMAEILNTLDGAGDGASGGVVRFFTGNDARAIFATPALMNRMSACFCLGYPSREMLAAKLDRLLAGAASAAARSVDADDRRGMREEEEEEEKKERELIKALEVGEQSGFVENFDPKQNLSELHRQHL